MGQYDRIDMDNVFYADFDSNMKIVDAVKELKELALETIERGKALGDQDEIERAVHSVAVGCPELLEAATDYYARHCTGQWAYQYLFPCREVYRECRSCIWEVRSAIYTGADADDAKLELEEALVEVEWLDYIRMRDLGKSEKKSISDQAKTVNDQIDKVKKMNPNYTHEPAVDQKSGGCYVATAVYGSYDCPQVWVLRRYRDNTLANSRVGRAFIHLYYAVSPTLVKWFGEKTWFRDLFRGKLDHMVERLREQGVEDTPYKDRNW